MATLSKSVEEAIADFVVYGGPVGWFGWVRKITSFQGTL